MLGFNIRIEMKYQKITEDSVELTSSLTVRSSVCLLFWYFYSPENNNTLNVLMERNRVGIFIFGN